MKKINLRGLKEVLSDKDLRNTYGGSGGGYPILSWRCVDIYGEEQYITGSCAGPDCTTCETYGNPGGLWKFCNYLGCTQN